MEVTSNNTSADCTTGDGAIVSYIGSNDTVRQSSGTGLFDPFVRLQADGTEHGFNTNAAVTLDAKAGQWTKAILVSAIPIINIGGTNYWELFVDINDKNSSKPISLNKLEIYFAPGPGGANITGYPGFTGFSATLVYAFDGVIKINDVNSGSGRGDLRYLVPLTNIPTPPAGTYFVLYSQWGTTSGYTSDGGFEEWKVRKASNVTVLKTANPVGPVAAGDNIGFDITVTNSGAADATNVTITDNLPAGGGGLNWSLSPSFTGCSISGAVGSQVLTCTFATIAAGTSKGPIHITSDTTQADCALVSNTAIITAGGTGSSTASVTVQCGALIIHKNSTKGGAVSSAEAVFSVDGPDADTDPDFSVTDDTTVAAPDEDADAGEICVTGLAPVSYTVKETSPPPGYGAGSPSAGQSVTVVNGTTCATAGAGATATFTNPPLGEIGVTFTDLGSGETNASIVCTGQTPVSENGGADSSTITGNSAANPTVVTTSTAHGLTSGATVQISGSDSTPSINGTWTVTVLSATTFNVPVDVTVAGTVGTVSAMDDTDETYTDLAPGTYNCQIVIDP